MAGLPRAPAVNLRSSLLSILVILLSPIVTSSSPLPAERAPATVYGVTQDDGISLNEAIERVRRLPDFRRLLSASTEARGNREVHFVKYMAQDGTVRKQSFTGRRR